MTITKVYIDGRNGSCKNGMNTTTVRFVFSNVIPKFAYRYYSLDKENVESVAVQAWVKENPTVTMSVTELRAKFQSVRADEVAGAMQITEGEST